MKNLNINLLLKIPLLKIPNYKKHFNNIENSENQNINLINSFNDEIYVNYENYLKSLRNKKKICDIPLIKTEKINENKKITLPLNKENNNNNSNNYINFNINNNNNNNNSTITTTVFYSSYFILQIEEINIKK